MSYCPQDQYSIDQQEHDFDNFQSKPYGQNPVENCFTTTVKNFYLEDQNSAQDFNFPIKSKFYIKGLPFNQIEGNLFNSNQVDENLNQDNLNQNNNKEEPLVIEQEARQNIFDIFNDTDHLNIAEQQYLEEMIGDDESNRDLPENPDQWNIDHFLRTVSDMILMLQYSYQNDLMINYEVLSRKAQRLEINSRKNKEILKTSSKDQSDDQSDQLDKSELNEQNTRQGNLSNELLNGRKN